MPPSVGSIAWTLAGSWPPGQKGTQIAGHSDPYRDAVINGSADTGDHCDSQHDEVYSGDTLAELGGAGHSRSSDGACGAYSAEKRTVKPSKALSITHCATFCTACGSSPAASNLAYKSASNAASVSMLLMRGSS
jgi:hypothetical protein